MREWTRLIRRNNIIINQIMQPKQPFQMLHLEILILKWFRLCLFSLVQKM